MALTNDKTNQVLMQPDDVFQITLLSHIETAMKIMKDRCKGNKKRLYWLDKLDAIVEAIDRTFIGFLPDYFVSRSMFFERKIEKLLVSLLSALSGEENPKAHEFYTAVDFGKDKLPEGTLLHTAVTDHGLAICRRCGLYEGALTTDCPGVFVSQKSASIRAGKTDYLDGVWISQPNEENKDWIRYTQRIRPILEEVGNE